MYRTLLFGVLILGLMGGTVWAQQPDTTAEPTRRSVQTGAGSATLTDWPDVSLQQLLREMGAKAPYLIPAIDSLGLDYRYAANDSTSQWSFVLSWQPGRRVLYQGNVMPWSDGPPDVRMVNVELRAEVVQDGRRVGEMIVAVDSMALKPLPSLYSFEVAVHHDRVFLDTSAEVARRALMDGVTLKNLVVERMGFASFGRSNRKTNGPTSDIGNRREEPRTVPSVYAPRMGIHVGWRVAPKPYYVDDRNGRRTVTPRGATVGRSAEEEDRREEGRSGGSRTEEGKKKADASRSDGDEDAEDEDDEPDLRVPALGAAATVAFLAYAGGTVGLYGRGDTPIGVAGGYTHPSGGFQLQASVNGAVLQGGGGQKLTAKALGFYDVFSARLQPAAGLGLQLDPQRETDFRPSVSVGLVGNFGRIVLYGGADVVQQTPEIGLTYNFRFRSR